MNLIEQFGSYEAAKVAALNYRNSGDALTAKKFESACLEHRRANNIFEVGDKVVFSDYFMNDEIMTISKIDGCEMWMDDDAKWTHNFNEMIRHAEPQEIEVGHRL